ncbi:hypothetical protein W02_26000 [Nitrospira sp. KM1]|uniref:DUF58 domain-containing protein n=1 Tax=Nitrospira sp. KM1 TaxID=1936990 RepID=UPI0013A78E0A|nr:DUF58 domain-containing protein [Nitrospira sp. KM1]BCA55460.1 hypothetical protein W02_26000 [Nitrospira sp. KM1]
MTPSSITSRVWQLLTRRSIRLTPEGTRFLLFTVAIGVAAINTGNNLFYLLLAMMLSLVIISGLLSEQCVRRLEFHRHLPDLIIAEEPATMSVVVINRNAHLPVFSVNILDVSANQDLERGLFVPQLPAQRSIVLSYPLLASARGWLHIDGIRAETLFPFGLFLKRAFYRVDAHVLVGPPIKPLSLRFVEELVSDGQGLSLPRRGHGTQLYNLRLYRPGDDSRAIHWMTTARTSQLMVRETEAEDQLRVTIVLSTVAPDESDRLFERSVTLVASILWHLSRNSYPLRLIVNDQDSSLGTGSDHLLSMLRLLALCTRRKPGRAEDHTSARMFDPAVDAECGYTIAVMPWSDAAWQGQMAGIDRILRRAQIEELTHAF